MPDPTNRTTTTTTAMAIASDGGLRKILNENRSAVARQLERERGRAVGDPMTEEQARAITDRIMRDVGAIWGLIQDAYLGRAWVALEYACWDDYCAAEFSAARLQLPREDRREVVGSLREAGMSIRAIASATGSSYGTVQAEVINSDHLDDEPDDENALAEELIAEPGLTVITGTDGKKYQRPRWPAALRKELAPPRRYPITNAFHEEVGKLTKSAERLGRLADDDRFAKYVEPDSVTFRWEGHTLRRHIDTLQAIADRIPNPIATDEATVRPGERPGATPCSREIQDSSMWIAHHCDSLTDEQVIEARGAAQFLYELLNGEKIIRERKANQQ